MFAQRDRAAGARRRRTVGRSTSCEANDAADPAAQPSANEAASRTQPSARLTSGAQPNAARVSRWSNQWAVESCSAPNAVIGGSPRPLRSHTASAAAPPAMAARGHRTGRPVDPRSGSDPGDQLVDGTRLAIRHDERPTTDSGEGIERSEQRGGGIVDPGRVDERQARADQRHAALAGPIDDAADQLGVARPDDEMGANGDDRHRLVRGRKQSPLRHCLGHRVVTMGPLRVGRRSTVATDRRTVMGDRRARDVHEPRHARSTSGRVHRGGALDVDRLEIGPVADRIDLRRRWITPSTPAIAVSTTSASVTEPRCSTTPSRPQGVRCNTTTSWRASSSRATV